VLLLDKPLGLSSNDALQKAKWLLRAEKAGHTGTLDPLATGVLPLCFGAATKFSQLQLDADKRYEAVARLGVTTTTGDAEGAVLQERPVAVTAMDVARVRHAFEGPVRQVPPMYSALKKEGKPLYEYARAGIEVERVARDVRVRALGLALEADESGRSLLRMAVRCSKGTYIRTLAEDIGSALGCGAHLVALRRVGTGDFEVAQSVTLERLTAMSDEQRMSSLLPVDALVAGHFAIELGPQEAGRFLSGLRRRGHWADCAQVAVYGIGPRALLGTGHVAGGELIPGRLLSPTEITQTLAAC
jgi:tRNA pseudouridine55 synthase